MRSLGLFSLLAAVCITAGCTSRSVVEQKDGEIARLRVEQDEQELALAQAQSEVQALKSELREVTSSVDSVRTKNQTLEKRLKDKDAEQDRLNTKSVQLTGRLLETERAYEELKKTLSRVQDEASSMAEELAVRLSTENDVTREFESTRAKAETLRRENRQLHEDVESLREELKRKDVAINSLRGAQSQPDELTRRLQGRVEELVESSKAHQDERVALHRQIEELKALVPEDVRATIAEASVRADNSIYLEDPDGLASEVGGFLAARFGAMASGEASWDGVDIGLATAGGVSTLGLLWLLFAPLRWKSRRAKRQELLRLRQRLKDWQSRDGAGGDRPRRPRHEAGSVVRRSAQFSAVLSASPGAYDDEIEEPSEAEEAARAPAGGYGPGAEDDDEEYGHTQIIPDVGEIELGTPRPTQFVGGRDPLRGSGAPAPSAAAQDDEDEDEDEYGNTQIIPSLDDVGPQIIGGGTIGSLGGEAPSAPSAPKASREDEDEKKSVSSKDLMNELEDLIGKKVDELIQ